MNIFIYYTFPRVMQKRKRKKETWLMNKPNNVNVLSVSCTVNTAPRGKKRTDHTSSARIHPPLSLVMIIITVSIEKEIRPLRRFLKAVEVTLQQRMQPQESFLHNISPACKH